VTRSTRRMPRVAAVVPALAVAAALLTGCGGPSEGGSAAVVGDRRITEADLQTATSELQEVVGADNQLTQSQVLSWMVLAPYTLDVASKNGIGVSVDDAVNTLQGKVTDPSDATLLAARSAIALSRLSRGLDQAASQQAYQDVLTQVKAVKVSVNPRYGSFDTKTFSIDAVSPNWLVKTATPAATASADPNAPATDPNAPADGSQPAPTP
jgi:hypothetical protein